MPSLGSFYLFIYAQLLTNYIGYATLELRVSTALLCVIRFCFTVQNQRR